MQDQGYSGRNFDRWVERDDNSTLHNIKKSYWTTKQAVLKKFGKKEDEHVVASDSQLDSKLEVFKAIQKSCMALLRVIEKYQDRLCVLSREENAMGRFLKSESGQDKTRAGKMMAAVGKSQSFSAQQRLALRVPLVRLYQEVETFRYRAISDTLMTINRMEGARTEYRGALLWMKDVSEELDPDTFKQLEKFRKVQAQVRKTKARFDRLKLDVMQKVDLLAASRCNMFSHVLATYQTTLLNFWSKTSRTMSAVAESFKGYQYYEFNMLKELQEPNKKLAEQTAGSEFSEHDVEDEETEDKSDRLLSLEDNEQTEMEDTNFEDALQKQEKELTDLKSQMKSSHPDMAQPASLLDFTEDEPATNQNQPAGNNVSSSNKPISKKQGPTDLLTNNPEIDDSEKDDLTLLNEILNAPSTSADDFTHEWQSVFGSTSLSTGAPLMSGEKDQLNEPADFMPSYLLDMTAGMGEMNMGRQAGQTSMMRGAMTSQMKSGLPPGGTINQQQPQLKKPTPASKKGQKGDMSAWFNLFADLDPLSNPDAIGKQTDELTEASSGV